MLEEEIPRMESAVQTVVQQMAVFVSAEQDQTQQRQLDEFRTELAALLAEWEELALQLEEQAEIS